jgi:hypothetical protein
VRVLFFFHDTAATEIYPPASALSLPVALPIYGDNPLLHESPAASSSTRRQHRRGRDVHISPFESTVKPI